MYTVLLMLTVHIHLILVRWSPPERHKKYYSVHSLYNQYWMSIDNDHGQALWTTADTTANKKKQLGHIKKLAIITTQPTKTARPYFIKFKNEKRSNGTFWVQISHFVPSELFRVTLRIILRCTNSSEFHSEMHHLLFSSFFTWDVMDMVSGHLIFTTNSFSMPFTRKKIFLMPPDQPTFSVSKGRSPIFYVALSHLIWQQIKHTS